MARCALDYQSIILICTWIYGEQYINPNQKTCFNQSDLIFSSILPLSYRQRSFLGWIYRARLIASLELVKFYWMYRQAARLQLHSSLFGFSFNDFSQLQMALSWIPIEQYESPRFLKRLSFYLHLSALSVIKMAYEQRPKTFNAAALLFTILISINQDSTESSILSIVLLQINKQSFGLFCSRYRQLKYYTAEMLFQAYFNEAQRYMIAFSAFIDKDFISNAKDFSQLYLNSSFSLVFESPSSFLYKFQFFYRNQSLALACIFYYLCLFLYNGDYKSLPFLQLELFLSISVGIINSLFLISCLYCFFDDKSSIGSLAKAQFFVFSIAFKPCSQSWNKSSEDLDDFDQFALLSYVFRCSFLMTGYSLNFDLTGDPTINQSLYRGLYIFQLGFMISNSSFFFSFIYISLLLSSCFKFYIF